MSVDREEILNLYNNGPDAVIAAFEKMDARIIELEAQIAELKALLGQNSRNSSRPPSTDVFIKPKSLRQKGERRAGGQSGHPGCTLKQVDTPDQVVVHRVTECMQCSTSLAEVPVVSVERRQVFEIPPLKIVVTEHRAETKQCPCCHRITKASFPAGVSRRVQYGRYLKAFVVYLLIFQFVPYDRIAGLFRDLFDHSPSKATLVHMVESCYNELGVVEEVIRGLLRDARVLHVDETGFRAAGKRNWLHVASTPFLTWYGHHKNRGLEAARFYGILPGFTGTMVHDHWKPYFRLGCGHSLCNAHLVRELQGITETFHQEWSGKMKELLHLIKTRVDAVRVESTGLPLEQIADFESRYREIVELGTRENGTSLATRRGKRGPMVHSKSKNLVDRCQEYEREVLAFMHDFQVPFDNNQAERDIRMAKLQQKISGTSRSDMGAAWFCRIRGYISTVKKNNQPVLASIVKAFEGRPFIPQTTN